ncbi:hypothetical protein ACLOJK_037191 [Asimina triloba]
MTERGGREGMEEMGGREGRKDGGDARVGEGSTLWSKSKKEWSASGEGKEEGEQGRGGEQEQEGDEGVREGREMGPREGGHMLIEMSEQLLLCRLTTD